MRRPQQIIDAIEAESARIVERYLKVADPLRREFQRLQGVIREHAHKTQNRELIDWLREQTARFDKDSRKVDRLLNRDKEARMRNQRASETFEEALTRLEHEEALANLRCKNHLAEMRG